MNDTAIAEKKNMNLAGSKIELTALEERHWGKFLQWHVFCKLLQVLAQRVRSWVQPEETVDTDGALKWRPWQVDEASSPHSVWKWDIDGYRIF